MNTQTFLMLVCRFLEAISPCLRVQMSRKPLRLLVLHRNIHFTVYKVDGKGLTVLNTLNESYPDKDASRNCLSALQCPLFIGAV